MGSGLLRKIYQPFTKPLCRSWANYLDRRVCRLTGMTRVSEVSADDIFIIGYPKSGNTWFQFLAAGILYKADPEYLPRPLVAELTPDIQARRFYRRYGSPMCFKSHDLPQPVYRRVVYLVRDGRDAMVSYYHFRSALDGVKPDFLHMIESGEGLFPCKWHEHVEAWMANPHDAEILTIRYEDLKADAVGQLRRFCEFAGLEREDAHLEMVARNSSFEKLSRREKEGSYVHQNPNWPKSASFFRKGRSGGYREEMPPEVEQAFLREAGSAMGRMGYGDTETFSQEKQ